MTCAPVRPGQERATWYPVLHQKYRMSGDPRRFSLWLRACAWGFGEGLARPLPRPASAAPASTRRHASGVHTHDTATRRGHVLLHRDVPVVAGIAARSGPSLLRRRCGWTQPFLVMRGLVPRIHAVQPDTSSGFPHRRRCGAAARHKATAVRHVFCFSPKRLTSMRIQQPKRRHGRSCSTDCGASG